MSTVTESSLDRGAIGLGEVLFQSVTSMAPAGAVALSIAAGATYAGGALPLAVLLARIHPRWKSPYVGVFQFVVTLAVGLPIAVHLTRLRPSSSWPRSSPAS